MPNLNSTPSKIPKPWLPLFVDAPGHGEPIAKMWLQKGVTKPLQRGKEWTCYLDYFSNKSHYLLVISQKRAPYLKELLTMYMRNATLCLEAAKQQVLVMLVRGRLMMHLNAKKSFLESRFYVGSRMSQASQQVCYFIFALQTQPLYHKISRCPISWSKSDSKYQNGPPLICEVVLAVHVN